MINGTANGHAAARRGPLVMPSPGRPIALPSLARLRLSQEQRRERTRLLLGRFFLVNMRQGGLGEVFPCSRCSGKHDRLTRLCIERPFSGLLGGLYAFLQTVAPAREIGALPPDVRARVDRIAQAFGRQDLADGHPQFARQLAGESDGDLDIGMVSLGLVERIEPQDAQLLLDRINTRAALYHEQKLVVPGLRTLE